MGRTGGKVVFVSGLLAMACAAFEVGIGAYGNSMHVERGATVVGLGMVGAFLSALAVAVGAAGRRRPRRWQGLVAVVVALLSFPLGGTYVAIAMLGTLAGGAMLVGGAGRSDAPVMGHLEGDVGA